MKQGKADEVFTTRANARDYHLAVTRANGTAWVETFTSSRALALRIVELTSAGHIVRLGARRGC